MFEIILHGLNWGWTAFALVAGLAAVVRGLL